MNAIALYLLLMLLPGGQAPQTGTVSGSVLDVRTGQPIRNAKVTIDGLPGAETVTDLDGIFRLDLPAGTYKLRFAAENFNEMTLDKLVVVGGTTVEASTVMADKNYGTSIEVVEQVAHSQPPKR